MRDRLHRYMPLLGLLLLCAAAWVLYRKFRVYHIQDIVHHIKLIPTSRILASLLFTGLSYFTLSGYDTIALRYMRRPFAYAKMALAAFISYAFGHNVGMIWLSSGSVRYRLYASWGFGTLEIAQILVFCNLTFWLGFCVLSGSVFIIEPWPLPAMLHLPFQSTLPLGAICLGLVVLYLIASVLAPKPLRIRTRQFAIPSLPFSLAQIGISAIDLALAGGALYALLPPTEGLTFIGFLGIFLLSYIAAMASQIPGGLGVLETIVLLLLPSSIPAPTVLGILLVYRAIYYLLPLCIAAICLGVHELRLRKANVGQAV